jgi:hypothetical protein
MQFLLAQQSDGGGTLWGAFGTVTALAIVAVALLANFRLFTKLGLPGWMGLIPLVNFYLIFKLRGKRPAALWLILFFIPCVGLVAWWFLCSDLAELFGKRTGWKLALFFFSGLAMLVLAFGDAQGEPENMTPGMGLRHG